jgi:hypothetical protein
LRPEQQTALSVFLAWQEAELGRSAASRVE